MDTVVGVDLGGTSIRGVVARGDRLEGRVQVATPARDGPAAVSDAIVHAVGASLAAVGIERSAVAAVGVAAPGPLNGAAGVVYSPPNLYGWRNVPLAAMLTDRLALPVHLIKDTNAAALAEHRLGAGRGTKTMLYVTLSTGIGGGLILDGSPYLGPDGTAGEVGHVTVDRNGPRCNCGGVGCVEAVASGTAIARIAAEHIAAGTMTPPAGHREPSAEQVVAAALAGDTVARAIVEEAGRAIGLALTGLIHLFNPERIVLGGGLVHAGAVLLDPIRNTVSTCCMAVPRARADICLAELGDDVGLWGAALHAMSAW